MSFDGDTKTLAEWSRDFRAAVSYHTLVSRLRSGWEFGVALTTPKQHQLTAKERRELLDDFRNGAAAADLAHRYEVSVGTIYVMARRAGIRRRSRDD